MAAIMESIEAAASVPVESSQRRWFPLAILVLATFLCLGPFLNKAVNIDDPLFIWTAHQIQKAPSDFYGFSANWYGLDMPMWKIQKNPPLASYYMAIAASILGWSEPALHFSFLLVALAAVVGTYRLAQRFCTRPIEAALLTLATPLFLLSATSVMCDVMMVALWIWAIVWWLRGLETNSVASFLLAAVLVAASGLTKYFGVSLIPLLLVYTVLLKKKWDGRVLYLCIPALLFAGYHWYTKQLYGVGLLSDAANYASGFRSRFGPSKAMNLLTGLSFIGGGMFSVLFFRRVWTIRQFIFLVCVAAALVVAILPALFASQTTSKIPFSLRPVIFIHLLLFCVTGVAVIWMAVVDIRQRRSADSVLLFLWILGTLAFAIFFNWTVNARSLLPMAPAVAIVLMRRLEKVEGRFWISLVPAAAVSMFVAWADYEYAGASRTGAETVSQRYKTTWFQGHWGFQYYMEQAGAKPMDIWKPVLKQGEILVIPVRNTNLRNFDSVATFLDGVKVDPLCCAAVFNPFVGAGFYTDFYGPLPYTFAPVTAEEFLVYRINEDVDERNQKPANATSENSK